MLIKDYIYYDYIVDNDDNIDDNNSYTDDNVMPLLCVY